MMGATELSAVHTARCRSCTCIWERCIRSGHAEDARKAQYQVNRIIEKLCSGHGSMYAVIKAVLKIREGLNLGSVRKPQARMAESG